MAVKEIEKAKIKAEIIEILDANGIDFNITTCGGCERICISFDDTSTCCNSAIIVQTCNKDVLCRVYLNEILFIAIENRKMKFVDVRNEMTQLKNYCQKSDVPFFEHSIPALNYLIKN